VRKLSTSSEDQTIVLGQELARELPSRCVVLLTGQLGAGKTTLAKGIVSGLGAAAPEEVSSPTYTLIHEYSPRVYHVDLYRLDEPGQALALGLEEIFDRDAVVLVEWGERFPEILPPDCIRIELRHAGGDCREILISEIGDGVWTEPLL
jgi:tRNA threonylcarbamoyladenosine biosynthesis protein TsaE